MFSFFRRYQRLIFLVVTAIIILSFSFFGTYSSMVNTNSEDPVLCTTLGGHKVKKSEMMAYIDFLGLSSDVSGDRRMNFFGEGFLGSDILSTPIGEAIFLKWKGSPTAEVLKSKKTLEASYRLYQHPQAPFIGTEYVWNYFAPNLKERFQGYMTNDGQDSLQLFRAKADLFVEAEKCPGSFIKHLLLYQQKQASWLTPDPSLEGRDLSLFGYQSATDWFGEEFMQHVVETVMNGAEVAEKEGVQVTEAEVMASLYENVKRSTARYSDLAERPLEERVSIAIRSLGLDLATIKKIQKTLLQFRQGYVTLETHLAVSTFPFRKELKKQAQSRTLEMFSLQPALRVHSLEDLGELFLWKQAVLVKTDDPLSFSGGYRPVDSVLAAFPEFVQERFFVSYRMVGPEQIEPLIKLRELWNWQADEKNFALLAEKFPRLLEEKAPDRESRLKAIEHLSAPVRLEVDQYSKKMFLQSHQEWIVQELQQQPSEKKVLFLKPNKEASDLPGISNMIELSNVLRSVELNSLDDRLRSYSQDGVHFYEFTVQERSKHRELVPLIQLRQDGTLAQVLQKLLEAQYPTLRKLSQKQFLQENGEWKPFQEVRSKVLEVYLSPLFSKLDQLKPRIEKEYPSLCRWSNIQEARIALFTLPLVLENVRTMQDKKDVVSKEMTYEEVMTGTQEAIDRAADTLFDFVKLEEKVRRDQLGEMPQLEPLFDVKKPVSSMVMYQPKAGTSYVVVVGTGEESYDRSLRATLYGLDDFIANSLRREKIDMLLQKMKS